jgi:hypothetical protein
MAEYIPRFATGYAFSAQELFTRFKLHYIKKCPYEAFHENSKKVVAARVFIYMFYLILRDVIDNNTTFKLPTSCEAYIEMGVVGGDKFIKARQNGAFGEIDFLASNFTGYKLQYRQKKRNGSWYIKPIHVHKKLKNIIIDNTNNGKKYG